MRDSFKPAASITQRPILIHWDRRNLPETGGNAHGFEGLALRMKEALERNHGLACEVRGVQKAEDSGDDFETDILVTPVLGKLACDPYLVRGTNQSNYGVEHGDLNLVSHHLSSEGLASAADAFNQRFRKNVDRVVMVNFSSFSDAALALIDFDKTLTRLKRELGDFTIFLCGSRHADTSLIRHAGTRIKNAATRTGIKPPIFYYDHVSPQQGEPIANPYQGLLARADCVIIVGNSRSVLSEAVFAGKKPVIAHKMYDRTDDCYTTIADFEAGRPVSLTCASRNVTKDIAAYHARAFVARATVLGEMKHFAAFQPAETTDLPLRALKR